MLLRRVKVRNFRCFEAVEVTLDQTTVLIGENNSGKTSFLDAIRLCLSRNITRRGAGLEDYDYHLPTDKSHVSDASDLSITLYFVLDDTTPDGLVQAIPDVIVFDDDNQQIITLNITSKYDKTLRDFVSDWTFLDHKDQPLPPKAKRPQNLNTLVQLMPLFYLSALRDAAREFQARSPFWSPFLKNPGLTNEVRDRLQAEISALNSEVLKSHASLSAVKARLAKVQEVVTTGKTGTVDIEALPGRISDLLSRTQINISGPTGASLPLTKHGAGTQSLAVIFLFEAFSATMLSEQFDPLSRPLLALEEPEAHLHPCAIRSLWTALEAIEGQKIIATHSGDLLARVPLLSVRRFCRRDGSVCVKRLAPDTLDAEERRKIEFHLRSARGELLFARCWLLGEGESEHWVFNEVAELLGHDLDRLGIRVVTYQNCGIRPLIKVANDLGIAWFAATDGDQQGQDDSMTCESLLDGAEATNHICVQPDDNIEMCLCVNGFGSTFEKYIALQKQATVTAQHGTVDYWAQVLKARDRTPKPAVLREVLDEMRQRGAASVPPILRTIIESAVSLAEKQA